MGIISDIHDIRKDIGDIRKDDKVAISKLEEIGAAVKELAACVATDGIITTLAADIHRIREFVDKIEEVIFPKVVGIDVQPGEPTTH